jgi:probable O-glycosylation ligase (exosortase A-associated)
MRDMVMFLAMLLMVPMAIRNGFVAYILWGYTTVLSPVQYLYGFMQGVRYNFIFAAIALWSIYRGKNNNDVKVTFTKTYYLMVFFLIHVNLSTLFAMTPNGNLMLKYEIFIKGFTFILAMPYFVKSRSDIHVLLAMIALGLGLHGVVEGLKYIVSGGSHTVSGIPGSSLTDNNLFAVGMAMLIPILLYFRSALANKYAKIIALCAVILTIFTIIATNSRGGFLAMSVLGFWYFVMSRQKVFALAIVLSLSVLVLQVAPQSWFNRISTIETADEDNSFMNRVAAWQVGSAIAIDNPVFGAGFSAIENYWIWEKYKSMPSFFSVDMSKYNPKAAHSIYFQIMSDIGFLGFFLFLSMFIAAYFNKESIKRKIKKYDRKDLTWSRDLSDSIFLSLLAYLVGGAGVSLTYYELIYILILLTSVLNTIVDAHIREKTG